MILTFTQADIVNILLFFLASIGSSIYVIKNPKVNFLDFNKEPNLLDNSVNQEENSDQENSSSEILEVAEKQHINTTNQSDQEISKISLETILKKALPVFFSFVVIYLLYKFFSAYPLTDFLFSL
ncbi:hypothetical protein QUB10_03885 [Microcoleus sp. B5-D4]|uniref:hypothetical protein n=1 Tax=unclassified Microcoleus TaxID=2642155 RepID=UPI002FD233DA